MYYMIYSKTYSRCGLQLGGVVWIHNLKEKNGYHINTINSYYCFEHCFQQIIVPVYMLCVTNKRL